MIESQVKGILDKLIENRKRPIKWIKNNVKIQHPAHGVIPFDLYDFQEKIINVFLLKHFIINLKSRQIGMSTLVQAISLWLLLSYSNYNILIISAGQRNATSFLSKLRKMYKLLPNNELKLKLTVDNKQSLVFSNGSQITAVPATESASLGESINLLIIDEAANIKKVENVYQAAYPTLSRAFKSNKGKPYGIIIISTPNGVSGTGKWYYEMYEGSINKTNKYVPIKVHWTAVPEYDEEWYLDQCKQLNWNYRAIASQLELSFVSSGNTYIPGQILDSIGTTDPLIKDLEEKLWIYEEPIYGETYVAGVDVAYGDRKDSSTIQVLKASTLEQVAEYDSNTIIPDKFADVIIDVTRMYNNALCNVERNAVGKVLIDKILEKTSGGIGMNLFRDKNKNELETNYNSNKDIYKVTIGTNVTGVSRDILLANMYNIILDKYTEAVDSILTDSDDNDSNKRKFKLLMQNKKDYTPVKKYGVIKSERLYHQLLNFIVDEYGKPIGPKDDLIFGWVHALYAWSKSKHILLKDIGKIIKGITGIDKSSVNKRNVIEFMKNNTDSKIWNDLSVEELQDILDEEYNENLEINNDEDNNKSSLSKLYKHFYK